MSGDQTHPLHPKTDQPAQDEAGLQRQKEEDSKAIPAELAEIVPEDLPDTPEELVALFAKLEQRSHRGPLPAPWTLEQYKAIDPRALDWVFDSATKEQDNRHWCDKEPLRQAGRAQIFAFVIAVLVIVVGGLLIYFDKSAAGLATILVPLATILGIFVYKEVRSKNTEIKNNQETKPTEPAA